MVSVFCCFVFTESLLIKSGFVVSSLSRSLRGRALRRSVPESVVDFHLTRHLCVVATDCVLRTVVTVAVASLLYNIQQLLQLKSSKHQQLQLHLNRMMQLRLSQTNQLLL